MLFTHDFELLKHLAESYPKTEWKKRKFPFNKCISFC